MPPCLRRSSLEPDLLSSDLREQVAQPLLNGLSRLATAGRRPVVLLNGPVGAGKSTLGRALRTLAPATGLRLAVASIDDAYLPLEERRRRLAGNPFGVSRVPPGSHDVELLLDRLARWRSGSSLRLPVFDKTLAAGEGERAGEATHEADALVLEGWLVGCRSIGAEALKRGVEIGRAHV